MNGTVAIINSFMTEVPICFANQWTGFYMIGTTVVKKLSVDRVNKDYLLGRMEREEASIQDF